jgi:hypothetical protein
MSKEAASINDTDIFLWLANNTPKTQSRKGTGKAGKYRASAAKGEKQSELSQRFIEQFSPAYLSKILRDGKADLTLEWYVKQILKLYNSTKTDASTKFNLLKEIKKFIVMGTLHYEQVAKDMKLNLPATEANRKSLDETGPFAKPRLAKKAG